MLWRIVLLLRASNVGQAVSLPLLQSHTLRETALRMQCCATNLGPANSLSYPHCPPLICGSLPTPAYTSTDPPAMRHQTNPQNDAAESNKVRAAQKLDAQSLA